MGEKLKGNDNNVVFMMLCLCSSLIPLELVDRSDSDIQKPLCKDLKLSNVCVLNMICKLCYCTTRVNAKHWFFTGKQTERKKIQEQVSVQFGMRMVFVFQLDVCYVRHKVRPYGIRIDHENGWSLSYSGDTMPCDNFIEMCKPRDDYVLFFLAERDEVGTALWSHVRVVVVAPVPPS